VREYLHRLTMLGYLPRPFSVAFGPLNRFLTTGFLPPPFRDQMQLPWTERDQRQFESLMRMIATVNRRLPSPIRRSPFNACCKSCAYGSGGNACPQLAAQAQAARGGAEPGRLQCLGQRRVVYGGAIGALHG
jgi:uncharacterized protein (DUF2236 family)